VSNADAAVEQDPDGELAVEREGEAVVVVIEEDGEEDRYYIEPETATAVAMWLNQAAAEAKQFAQQHGGDL